MTRTSATIMATLAVAVLALPSPATSQTFTVEKYNIGGDGGTDYLVAEPGTGRVFVSRSTHVMVVDGATGGRGSAQKRQASTTCRTLGCSRKVLIPNLE